MSDSTHTLVYQRFFAVLFSVLPGLNLILGLSALTLYLLVDMGGLEWGWGVGISAIVLSILFLIWIFVGLGVQKWAEEKPAGMLFGLNAPFIVVDLALLGWLFKVSVINFLMGGEEESARVVIEALSSLV